MRAHIVFAALQTQNRFALCHLAFKSIRKLHKPSTRIQDTANDVLQRLAGVEAQPIGAESASPIEAIQDVSFLETKQESAIASQTGEQSAEPPAETEDPGSANIVSSR